MEARGFQNLAGRLDGRRLGLGWLEGVTVQASHEAVVTDWHVHDTAELLFCLKGETRYEIDGYAPVALGANAWMMVPEGTRHRVSDAIDMPGHRLSLNLRATMARTRRFGVFTAADYARFRAELDARAGVPQPCSAALLARVRQLDALARRPAGGISPPEWGLARLLACEMLYEAVFPPVRPEAAHTRLMDDAVKWLERHLAEDVSLAQLVAYMGYGRARFFDLFKRHTGLSPNEYLVRLRVRQARNDLTATELSVREIGERAGFPSPGYFSAVFKRHTGRSPAAYRAAFAGGGAG